MQDFELDRSAKLEVLASTALAGYEIINQTEIDGFEDTGLLTDQEVADFVRETLPPSHLERCPSVQYEPEHPEFASDPWCLAFFQPWDHEIRIGPAERFQDAENMLETITHELGHNVHTNLIDAQPDLASRWDDLHSASWGDLINSGTGFVSDYATTNVNEDFAESYRVYVHNPDLLQFVSPDKYEFMRIEVFSGREYPSAL